MDILVDSELSIGSDDFCYLQSILANGYDTKVVKYVSLTANTFECTVRNAIATKSEAIEWLTTFEKVSTTSWRTLLTYTEETQRIIFKKDYYRCHHNTLPKKTSIPHAKHTNCSAKLRITVKRQLKKSGDRELKTRPCEIFLRHTHNHELYYSLFKKEYGESSGDGMVQKLMDLIKTYNEKCGSNCASWMSKNGNLIVCICDPFMKRIHENLPMAGEIIFIDSSGNMDRHGSRIFCLLCPSPAGAFTLGVIITFSESEEVLTESFNCLKAILPEKAFYGGGYPKLIITDDSSAERNSLRVCFPHSKLLLCKFHVLQAAMRYFWDSKHKILHSDRKEIFTIFQRLVNSADCDSFTTKYKDALENPLIKQYDFAVKYFLQMKLRASEWALCYRSTLITRGNDTNNYSEANFRILKDIVLKRTKAFSVVQLFSFLTTQLIDYYKRRLTDVLNDRYEGYIKSKYYISDSTLVNLSYEKVGNDIYSVKNTVNNNEYCVNLKNLVCSCPVGIQGAPCKHQYLVMKNENISSLNVLPRADKQAKMVFHKILTGNTDFDDSWYNPLHEKVDFNRDVNVSECNMSETFLQRSPEVAEESRDDLSATNQTDWDLQSRKESVKETLKNMFEEFNTFLDTNPEEFLPALYKFSESYNKCKTTSAKLSALHTFGKNSSPVAPLIKKGLNLQGSKLISVQPTAVTRRKINLGGRSMQQSGRPPKRARADDHNYANESRNKRIKAGPHSISVSENDMFCEFI